MYVTIAFRRLGLDADQCRIVQAVVGAFKLKNLVAARRGPGEPDSVHGGFRTARAET